MYIIQHASLHGYIVKECFLSAGCETRIIPNSFQGTQQKEIKVCRKVGNLEPVWIITADNSDITHLLKSALCAEKLLRILKNV